MATKQKLAIKMINRHTLPSSSKQIRACLLLITGLLNVARAVPSPSFPSGVEIAPALTIVARTRSMTGCSERVYQYVLCSTPSDVISVQDSEIPTVDDVSIDEHIS